MVRIGSGQNMQMESGDGLIRLTFGATGAPGENTGPGIQQAGQRVDLYTGQTGKDEEDGELLRLLKQMQMQEKKDYVQTDKPKDTSANLTKRLVSSHGQFEVRQILSEASADIVKIKMVAALSSDSEYIKAAQAYVKRLEQVINRCGRKIKDLDGEDILKMQKMKAEKRQQEKSAEEIKKELRKQQMARMMKEHSYLTDAAESDGQDDGKKRAYDPNRRLDTATEVAIAIQAQIMAAAQAAVADTPAAADSGGGGTAAAASGTGEAPAPQAEGAAQESAE